MQKFENKINGGKLHYDHEFVHRLIAFFGSLVAEELLSRPGADPAAQKLKQVQIALRHAPGAPAGGAFVKSVGNKSRNIHADNLKNDEQQSRFTAENAGAEPVGFHKSGGADDGRAVQQKKSIAAQRINQGGQAEQNRRKSNNHISAFSDRGKPVREFSPFYFKLQIVNK